MSIHYDKGHAKEAEQIDVDQAIAHLLTHVLPEGSAPNMHYARSEFLVADDRGEPVARFGFIPGQADDFKKLWLASQKLKEIIWWREDGSVAEEWSPLDASWGSAPTSRPEAIFRITCHLLGRVVAVPSEWYPSANQEQLECFVLGIQEELAGKSTVEEVLAMFGHLE